MTLDGWPYRHLLAPEYGITNQVLGGVVDTRLPDRLEDLPRDADLPNRFLVYSAFGDGPAKKLGTVFGAAGVCKADSVPMELSERFREGANRVRERGGGTLFAEEDICMVESGEESTSEGHASSFKGRMRTTPQGSPAKQVREVRGSPRAGGVAELVPATTVSGAVGVPAESARTSTPTPRVATSASGMEPIRAYVAPVVTASVVVTSSPPCSTAVATASAEVTMNKSAAEKELARRTAAARMEARAPSAAGHAKVFETLAHTATSTAVTQPISTTRPQQGIPARTVPHPRDNRLPRLCLLFQNPLPALRQLCARNP